MESPTYTLFGELNSSDHFYKQSELAAENLLTYFDRNFKNVAETLLCFESARRISTNRNLTEYYVELLMLIVLWNEYSAYSYSDTGFKLTILKLMGKLRKKYDFTKDTIDKLRAKHLRSLVRKHAATDFNLKNLKRFAFWLGATGDYNQYSERLNIWAQYFRSFSAKELQAIYEQLQQAGNFFNKISNNEFDIYTQNVNQFVTDNKSKYLLREDLFSCLKRDIEYHLNMVCSEMLNISYKNDFTNSGNKYVLAPGCMRPAGGLKCKAEFDKLGGKCKICDKSCGIFQLIREGKTKGFEVRILKHSSDLSNWSRKKCGENRGVVGIACVPALLEGGLELRKNRVPAQCVFLDYSGCSKHWCNNDCQTSINYGKLSKVLNYSKVIEEIV